MRLHMRSKLNRFAHSIIKYVRYSVNAFFPKNRNKIFFDSFPDYSDNCKVFSDYILNKRCKKYIVYWAVESVPQCYDKRIHFIIKKGWINKWRYIYHTLTSMYLFSTHGAFHWCNPNLQRYVCFWHGTPLKRICQMKNPDDIYYQQQVWRFIAPSDFYVDIYAKSFGRDKSEVLLTGYPRCDLLFEHKPVLEKLGLNQSNQSKIVLYMPTFRQPVGGGYSDSTKNVFEDDFINFRNHDDLNMWNEYFKKMNIILIVKPHPSDNNIVDCNSLSNIKIVLNDILMKKNIQLYSLLENSDALLTDFSSVYCDYLLLNRPIGFVITDIKEYAQGRGFIFENPIDFMPGQIISNKSDFIAFFENIAYEKDNSYLKRTSLMQLYNSYNDGCNCERIAREMNLK